ncbi:MAG TPA: hypothetical protein VGG76_03360 [Gemmatimonadaceae bacterium]|jgi:hypothetical protein
MRANTFLSLASALLFSGCNLVGGRCSYQLRSLDAAGTVSSNGTELASAQWTSSEQRGSLQGQSVAWLITGSLKGHVTAVSFKDSADPSKVLLDLTVASADKSEISRGAASSSTGAAIAGFHDIVAAGRGIIELQTDLSTTPTVIALTVSSDSDWITPYCS